MDLKIKIYIVNEAGEKFLGIGVLWLLQAVGQEGSIRKAAAGLGISYTKALRMLRVLEASLDRQVLVRRKGGESRDGARLTAYGLRLIESYSRFQREVREGSRKAFEEFARETEAAAGKLEEE